MYMYHVVLVLQELITFSASSDRHLGLFKFESPHKVKNKLLNSYVPITNFRPQPVKISVNL